MKSSDKLFQDINSTLDGYHYYTKEEVEENRQLFISAIETKDINYLNDIIALFDETIEEEKQIIDNIHFLIK